jgi:viroplasmin and RNaseH domain-containing protein
MKLQIANNFDQKLAELYSSKVTVNLDNRESIIDPNKFWNSMELIAVNHKAMINYRLK